MNKPFQLVVPALVLLAAASGAWSVPEEHEHEGLITRSGLTLSELVDKAVAHHTDQWLLDGQRELAESWQRRSRSWIAGTPQWTLRYQTDRLNRDDGLLEFEAGVSLPLWRPGARRATRALGGALTAGLAADQQALRWRVAGDVRFTLWALAKTRLRSKGAALQLAAAATFSQQLSRQVALGEISDMERLLGEVERLAVAQTLAERQAELVDLERAYVQLTGLRVYPTDFTESLIPRPDLPHPLIAAAEAAVAEARRRLPVAVDEAMGRPSLLMGPRGERPQSGADMERSVGVTLSIPLGGGAHRQAARAEAAMAVAEARRALEEQRRAVESAEHEAVHRLRLVESQRALAAAALTAAGEYAERLQKAFAAGEAPLVELVRARRSARQALEQAEMLELDYAEAVAARNQALGVVP